MKFICNTKELSNACNNVMRAVNAKVTIPTIEGILIECGSDKLSLTGYDFEFGINTVLDVEVVEPGAIVINAKVLCDIIRKLNDNDDIIIETNSNSVSITSANVQYNINGIDAEDYPELPSVNNGTKIELDQNMLYSMVNQTIFAVADNEASKPVFTGVKFEINGNILTMIGVDGYRLAIRKEKIEYNGDNIEFVVPKKTIREIMKLLNLESDNKINLLISKRHIVFEVENYSIISRLLEGEFIDYMNAVPKEITTTVLINTDDAIECIEKTLPVIENNQKNPIRCLFDADEMRVSTVSGLGRVINRTHANTAGSRIEIGFNSKYMLDALNASGVDQIKIQLLSPVSPTVVKPIDSDKFIFLVLPMRLKNDNKG